MLRTPFTLATIVAALLHASTSLADEPNEYRYTPPAQPPPTQPPPSSYPVQQAPPAPRGPAGTTTTTAAPYSPPGAERVVLREEKRYPNGALLGTGTGLFIMSYVPSVFAGAMSDRDEDRRLFIPVAGPWMDLNDRRCGGPRSPCGPDEDFAKAMIVTSGIVQGASALMVLGSLVIPETTSVPHLERTARKPSVRVLPVSYNGGAGIGAIGRF
jgi:hypothetical protein